MITGSIPPDRQMPTLLRRVWSRRLAIAFLIFGIANLIAWAANFGAWSMLINRFSVQNLGPPALFMVISGLLLWNLLLAVIVIPHRTIVWFRYDERTFEYRRFGDDATHTFRPLDVLRIDARSDNRKGIVRYTIRLVSGTRLVIDCQALENSHEVAEQLATDIAHSPRWMFS